MSLQNVLFSCHGAIQKIIKVDKDVFYENGNGTLSWNEWLDLLKEKNIKNSFYINGEAKSRIMNYIFYVDFEYGVYLPLHIGDFNKSSVEFQFRDDLFENVNYSFKNQIDFSTKHHKELLDNKDYSSLYAMIPKTFALIDFNKRYKDIPDDMLVDVFKSVYCKIDYNCNYIDIEILKRVKKLNNYKSNKTITIYRGHGTYSPDIDKVYSWTTDINVAIKFALMRKTPHCIYKAKVRLKDIVTKIDLRNEKEVIVLPDDVLNLELVDYYPCDNDTIINIAKKYLNKYCEYAPAVMRLKYLEHYNNLLDHNIKHSVRILFYVLMVSKELKLSAREKKILSYCAAYHDLGRYNDAVDDNHGEESVKILNSSDNFYDFGISSLDDINVAKAIIKYHCVDDEIASHNLSKHAFKLYQIFKDLDALDRVRFCGADLDVNYFRFDSIRKYLLLAAGLTYNGIDSIIYQ